MVCLSQAVFNDYTALWLEEGRKSSLLEIGGKKLRTPTALPFKSVFRRPLHLGSSHNEPYDGVGETSLNI